MKTRILAGAVALLMLSGSAAIAADLHPFVRGS